MATIKAAASGNWSATATWSGGVVPSLNDTVYANGFTVALDQSIELTGSTVDTSGSFIPGQIYVVVSLGTTNFALTANCIAPGTNAGTAVAITSAVGQIFQAVNSGTATTGTARRMGALLNYVNTPLTVATGGSFTLAASYNITGAYIQAGSANCLTVSAAASSTLAGCHATGSAFTLSTRAIAFSSSGTLTLDGIIALGGRVAGTTVANGTHAIESTSAAGTVEFTNASTLTGGSGVVALGINNNSTGTVTITSSTVTGGSGGSTYSLNNNSTGAVTVTSSTVTGGSGSLSHGLNNASTGAVTVTSSTLTGGSSGTGITNASAGTVTANSTTLTGGSGTTATGITNSGTGTIVLTGDITATNSANGLASANTAASVKVSGSLISSANGTPAVYAVKFLIDPTPTTAKFRQAKNGSTTYSDFFTADNSLGQASVADVRSGTVYASGLLTGTCAVPAASSVASGVPVDASVGSAVLTAAAIRTELAVELARIDAAVSSAGNAPTAAQIRSEMDSNSTKLANLDATVSSRLAPSGTLATVTTLTNAPTVPTAAAIATQVRSELATELARVDAAVSTRLAGSSYTAAPTTAQIATAVEGSLLNEADGSAVLNAIVGAIGNTNLSEVSLVAAVRADLERVGGKIDSIPAAPTAAANATAVWATASKTITGGTVDTLTNSPSVPSAASIASATRTELAVELARVDVATSTRLASSAYTAPANSDVAAIKAKSDLLNTSRLANVATTAIVGNLIAQANS
jgi:hypothetical protein